MIKQIFKYNGKSSGLAYKVNAFGFIHKQYAINEKLMYGKTYIPDFVLQCQDRLFIIFDIAKLQRKS